MSRVTSRCNDYSWSIDLIVLRDRIVSSNAAVVLVLAGLAGALRLVNLGQESLWYDEAFTAWLARLPFGAMMAAVRGDVHPPLWYVIEWGIVHLFGDSAFALRFPAAILSCVAVVLVWQLANRPFLFSHGDIGAGKHLPKFIEIMASFHGVL